MMSSTSFWVTRRQGDYVGRPEVKKIPTFRRNNGKMYHVKSQSWLTPKDRLACLGYPVTEQTATAMGVPVIPVKDRLRAGSVAGNSFHFATAACVQLVALSCYKMAHNSL